MPYSLSDLLYKVTENGLFFRKNHKNSIVRDNVLYEQKSLWKSEPSSQISRYIYPNNWHSTNHSKIYRKGIERDSIVNIGSQFQHFGLFFSIFILILILYKCL